MNPPPGQAPRVQVQNLNFAFGKGDASEPVLKNINLTVSPGSFVILTGPSGCGKTTLLTLIGALRSVQEGSVRVLGKELNGLSKKERMETRRNIGFIFQAHNLIDSLTAAQNVNMGLALKDYTAESLTRHAADLLSALNGRHDAKPLSAPSKNVGRSLVNDLLSHLKMGHRVDHKPKALSGGEKQRVAIARALVNNPSLILADEPTAALDRDSCAVVVDLLKKLTQNGSTLLVVTHDDRIMNRGDRIVTMADGEIISDNLVDETVRICLFLRKVPLLAGLTVAQLVSLAEKVQVEKYAGGTAIIRQGEAGDRFYVIRQGSVDVLIEGESSSLVATLREGAPFGEKALVTGEPRSATVVARESVEVYALGKADFLQALDSCESMREELVKVFAQRHRRH